jgi:hypothetical protein
MRTQNVAAVVATAAALSIQTAQAQLDRPSHRQHSLSPRTRVCPASAIMLPQTKRREVAR